MSRIRLRWLVTVALLALILPAPAFARGTFHPEEEFALKDWVPIHLGPLNMSINKAVVYLWIGGLLTMGVGWFLMRSRLALLPGRRQTIGEAIYEVTQTQIAEQGLPSKAIGRWFPYVAALFLFIWVSNVIGFIPLPITNEKFHIAGTAIPTWGIYTAMSQISVTLMLAILSVVFTHVEGVRYNGLAYFKSFVPAGVPKPMVPLMAVLETISHVFRVVSLSVRLYANMLAGHMLILVFIGLIFIFETAAFAVISVPLGVVFYLFEVLIVVTIQAYIFAALTAIYIGSAVEPGH
jgi:F-type H+-transporting ATPase subunit a